MSENTNNILPCPFCGYDGCKLASNDECTDHVHTFVRCPGCEAEGPTAQFDDNKAIRLWNAALRKKTTDRELKC